MKNLILWAVLAVAFFTFTFPTLLYSQRRAALIAKFILNIVIGFCIGYGLSNALRIVLIAVQGR